MPLETHYDSQEWMLESFEKCSKSLERCSMQFFGGPNGRFDRDFSAQHGKFFEVWDDRSVQKILVLAHRGWGKTSLFTYAAPAQAIIFDHYKFIAPCSATSKLAVMQSENLKRELRQNLQVRGLIGDIKEGSEDFTKEGWTTAETPDGAGGHLILPRGVGQQIRGVLHGNTRLELGICDDLETPEGVRSELQRSYLDEWFNTDFSLAVDMSSSRWRLVVVGTILSDNALLQDLREDSTWTTVEMPLCDDDGRFISNWPKFRTDQQVLEMRDYFAKKGKLPFFYREYMNIAVPPEAAIFKKEYFQDYQEADLDLNSDPDIRRCVIIDPAKSTDVKADFTAIVGLAIDVKRARIYVRDVINERMEPHTIPTRAFQMANQLNAHTIGYEVTSLNEWITYPMNNESIRQGFMGELIELKPRRSPANSSISKKAEDGRIAALAPFYRMKQVFHNPGRCDELEFQLTRFDRGKYDDIIDALSYVIQMMHIGDVYFETQWGQEEDQSEQGLTPRDDFEAKCAHMEMMDDEPIDIEVG
jgi:hypothetical protein